MSQKTSILWIAHEANLSGANLALLEYINACSSATERQVLVLPHEGNMRQHAERLGALVQVVHFYPWVRQPKEPFLTRKLLKMQLRNTLAIKQMSTLLRRHNISRIYSNTVSVAIGGWLAILHKVHHTWMIHEMGEEDFGFRLALGKAAYRFIAKSSDKVFYNSHYLAGKYTRLIPARKSEVMYYPIILQTEKRKTIEKVSTPFSLLLMGQVLPSKGQHEAIEALHRLKLKGYSVRLSIVGNAENTAYKKQLEDLIVKYALEGEVDFESFVLKPNERMLQADALLVCSRCEAFGRVTVEAMKLGLPVVAADTCGCKELVTDMQTGVSYRYGHAESLVRAIETIMANAPLRSTLAANAMGYAEKVCSIEHVKQRLLSDD